MGKPHPGFGGDKPVVEGVDLDGVGSSSMLFGFGISFYGGVLRTNIGIITESFSFKKGICRV